MADSRDTIAIGAALNSLSGGYSPAIQIEPLSDISILTQGRDFASAQRQILPLAQPGTREAMQAIPEVSAGSALPSGLRPETSERLVTQGTTLDRFITGRNAVGKAAEVMTLSDLLELLAGRDPGMVNTPRIAPNLVDVRLSPHHASRKDMAFLFRTEDGMLITRLSGQVKTGATQYVYESLLRMAETPGYGRTGWVDARLVNPDGTPRVAPDAFTSFQAGRLRKAGVRLHGIPDLETRAEQLIVNIGKYAQDGLDPVARAQLQQLRDDIASAYQFGPTGARMLSGMALSAASAMILSLMLQIITDGKVDMAVLGGAAGQGALVGGGGILLDAAFYHGAIHAGLAPEAAQVFARNGVASSFCLIALGADFIAELKNANAGQVSGLNAAIGFGIKATIDVLPLMLAPLGLPGMAVAIAAQLGGRWFIGRVRQEDANAATAGRSDFEHVNTLSERISRMRAAIQNMNRQLDMLDAHVDDALRD